MEPKLSWKKSDVDIPGEILAHEAFYFRSYDEIIKLCIESKESNPNFYSYCSSSQVWEDKVRFLVEGSHYDPVQLLEDSCANKWILYVPFVLKNYMIDTDIINDLFMFALEDNEKTLYWLFIDFFYVQNNESNDNFGTQNKEWIDENVLYNAIANNDVKLVQYCVNNNIGILRLDTEMFDQLVDDITTEIFAILLKDISGDTDLWLLTYAIICADRTDLFDMFVDNGNIDFDSTIHDIKFYSIECDSKKIILYILTSGRVPENLLGDFLKESLEGLSEKSSKELLEEYNRLTE